ncbi:MAG: IS21-like element helper ATPase IstB [Caldicoprobacterales bacterium]|jgi:DNA replication protein DnaC|uniref:IS21-like element helper ATPase IstB n=1 Tax=Desulfofalx alkaliphila TaxID=105483 RepID=UPI0004E20044|nr:IS21-like element helper ATPase IstB [Desulfofalx alkaliphila]MDD3614094.1 IS21-like element helper ATPase IstB [Clostridia bacterium]NLI59377.1 ATP-binding protein [Clostridium sp.]
MTDTLKAQTIELYSKQLRTPMFNKYLDVIRQLDKNQGYEDFLIALMRVELDSRQESTRRRKIKSAGFPYLKTIDELDLSRFEHMDNSFVHELASCNFISKRQNIVMIGNPGTGKTHLSIALGIKACMQGMNVKFYTAANLSNQLIEAQDNHRLIRLEKQIAKADLLIIDELSYLTFNRHQSELLFKVVADRAERRSVIVSTNLRFSEWTSMFENHTMVTALIDRLTFRSHVLNMNSDNPYRAEHAAKVSD